MPHHFGIAVPVKQPVVTMRAGLCIVPLVVCYTRVFVVTDVQLAVEAADSPFFEIQGDVILVATGHRGFIISMCRVPRL